MDTWQNLDPKGWDESIQLWLEDRGFKDSSWHNDMCPSFIHEDREWRVWIDDSSPAEREVEGASRFELHQMNDDEFTANLGCTDDWRTLCAAIDGLLALKI